MTKILIIKNPFAVRIDIHSHLVGDGLVMILSTPTGPDHRSRVLSVGRGWPLSGVRQGFGCRAGDRGRGHAGATLSGGAWTRPYPEP